jgi:hypothetical protein
MIRVVQNNSTSGSTVKPVVGTIVKVTDKYNCVNLLTQLNFSSIKTNSSGWASLLFGGAGTYYLNIFDGGLLNYTLSVPTYLVSTTFVTYSISTGNVTTFVCNFKQHC